VERTNFSLGNTWNAGHGEAIATPVKALSLVAELVQANAERANVRRRAKSSPPADAVPVAGASVVTNCVTGLRRLARSRGDSRQGVSVVAVPSTCWLARVRWPVAERSGIDEGRRCA